MALGLNLDPQATSSGIFGYNGLLVGMALPTFLNRDGLQTSVALASLCIGGLSTIIQLSLANALIPTFSSPPFTLAFNFSFLLFLLASAQWSLFSMPHHAASLMHPPLTVAISSSQTSQWAFHEIIESSLVAVGQVFLCESSVSGALILSGMFISSRIAAASAFSGALLANVLATALGVASSEIRQGLWGYSSSLTAVAVATFFTPSFKSIVMGALGVVLTGVLLS